MKYLPPHLPAGPGHWEIVRLAAARYSTVEYPLDIAQENIHNNSHHPNGLSYGQVAEALGHLPDFGHVNVLKIADGVNRTYEVPANESSASNSSWTYATFETYLAWEWEITFVTRVDDVPLMAAVWSEGRTSSAQDGGFGGMGRSTRLICGSCEDFPSGSWSATAEAVLGHRMEVKCAAGTNSRALKTYFETCGRSG